MHIALGIGQVHEAPRHHSKEVFLVRLVATIGSRSRCRCQSSEVILEVLAQGGAALGAQRRRNCPHEPVLGAIAVVEKVRVHALGESGGINDTGLLQHPAEVGDDALQAVG